MDQVRTVLDEAEKQLVAIGTLYGADLELQRPSPTLRGKIRGFVGNQRAALDHLAHDVVAAHGAGEAHTHYPFAAEADAFEASVDKNMPGVREQRPDVAATVARHQPFSVPALARLRDLLTDDTRQRLVPETRDKPKEPAPEGPPEGAAGGGAAGGPAPAPEAPPAPPANQGGIVGLTGGVFINGVAYDPITLQRKEEERKQQSTVIYVDWRFEGSDESALSTLQAIDAAVRAAVDEVSATAGLAARPD